MVPRPILLFILLFNYSPQLVVMKTKTKVSEADTRPSGKRGEAEVDEAYTVVMRDAEKWGLHEISKPKIQHGTYCFYFWDADDNCWEILCNPKGGYSWMFERGDQEGLGHMKKSFARPTETLSKKSD